MTYQEKLQSIRLAIFDVDGVFTDGRLYLNHEYEEGRAFHIQDGLGIKLLLSSGIDVAVITAKQSKAVAMRFERLGVKYLYQGYEKKLPAFEEVLSCLELQPEQALYVGDDFPDLPLIHRAGMGVAVKNARVELKEAADYVTEMQGGEGAVREVCELILKAQNKWPAILQRYE